MLRRVVIAVPLAASLVLGLGADAGARARRLHAQPRIHKASTSTAPTITSVSPLKTNVGQKLTILGKHFRAGKNRNRVFFLRQGGGIASGVGAQGTALLARNRSAAAYSAAARDYRPASPSVPWLPAWRRLPGAPRAGQPAARPGR